jgi:hypothetical protein
MQTVNFEQQSTTPPQQVERDAIVQAAKHARLERLVRANASLARLAVDAERAAAAAAAGEASHGPSRHYVTILIQSCSTIHTVTAVV